MNGFARGSTLRQWPSFRGPNEHIYIAEGVDFRIFRSLYADSTSKYFGTDDDRYAVLVAAHVHYMKGTL